jgi:magnesium transporter
MIRGVATAHPEDTIAAVRARISKKHRSIDTLQYVYVLDDSGKLTGVLSMKALFGSGEERRVGDVCVRRNLVSVRPTAHQERVAYTALLHGLKAVPVTDHDHMFLGVIPGDAVQHILYKEMHEDALRRSGIHHGHPLFDNVLTIPIARSILHRVPWLLIGLAGGLLASGIVDFFETTLRQNLILASFIPLIVYMSDAVGTQMEAFIIRDLAIDNHFSFLRYLLRQLWIVSAIGIMCSGLLAGASYLLHGDSAISIVLGLSLFAAIVSSIITGLIVPFTISHLRFDPANVSGPVATIAQDILSLVIYFSIATTILS